MNALVATVLTAGARWSERLPGPTIESPEEGSPGFAGFVATFLLAAAVIVLAVSFTRRMRRADHRERVRERSAAPHEHVDGDGDVARHEADGAASAAGADGPSHASGGTDDPDAAPGGASADGTAPGGGPR